jgi:outer membrane protein assembly factor BamC
MVGKKMKVLHIGISSVALVSLVGCGAMGLGNKRIDYGASAAQVPTLEIPPDLSTPETDSRFKVAGEGESVTTYSDYTKGEAVSSSRGNGTVASAVLPEVKGVTLEREGARHWLRVADKAENVWPVVKAFLHETGLNVQKEDQAAGLIETDWAENRAKIPQGGLRSVIGKVFDGLYSSGEMDSYRIRLERKGADTEVHITHHGKEEMLSADNSSRWQSRPNDPELETELLQRLMVRFGGSPVQAAALATPGATAVAGSASLLQVVDGSSVIVVNDAFDKTWRRVGLAIDRAGFAVEDKDREKGFYFLRTVKVEKGWMDKLKFWKDEEKADARYRVTVKEDGATCVVSVTDQNGVSGDESAQKLDAIFKNINQ